MQMNNHIPDNEEDDLYDAVMNFRRDHPEPQAPNWVIEVAEIISDKLMHEVKRQLMRPEFDATAPYKDALDAIHYYVDASDQELIDDGLTRERALYLARELREKLLK